MTRIRVDTEDLKAKAKDFESAADAFARAGDDIAAIAAAMPSYDGQLSGPARKAGAEIQSQARDMRTALANDAQFLKSAAQGFEAVNNQTIDGISKNQYSLLAAGSFGGFNPSQSRGTSYLGYNEDPANPSEIILCMYGECRKVTITEQNKAFIEDFKNQVDGSVEEGVIGYYQAKKARDDAAIKAGELIAEILVWGSVGIAASGPTATISVWAALAKIASMIPNLESQKKIQEDSMQDMVDATTNAAEDWNEIWPGENQTGDPTQHIGDDAIPGGDKPVYEPTP